MLNVFLSFFTLPLDCILFIYLFIYLFTYLFMTKQRCDLEGLASSTDLRFLLSLFKALVDRSKRNKKNWHHHNLHVPQLFQLSGKIQVFSLSFTFTSWSGCPVGWGYPIHRLLLCRGVRPPTNECPDMTLNNLKVRFQQCWTLGECGVPLSCHRSLVLSGPEWQRLIWVLMLN